MKRGLEQKKTNEVIGFFNSVQECALFSCGYVDNCLRRSIEFCMNLHSSLIRSRRSIGISHGQPECIFSVYSGEGSCGVGVRIQHQVIAAHLFPIEFNSIIVGITGLFTRHDDANRIGSSVAIMRNHKMNRVIKEVLAHAGLTRNVEMASSDVRDTRPIMPPPWSKIFVILSQSQYS